MAYLKGIALAVAETNLPEHTFPKNYPYNLAQVLGDRFFPGEPNEWVDELQR